MTEIKIHATGLDICRDFTNLLKSLLSNKERLYLSLSGGSTPKILFQYWSDNHKNDVPWERIYFFWGDERCVPPDHKESNFGMTKKILFNYINVPQENIFRILGENDPVEEAERYQMIIGDVLPKFNGTPQFDIMMLGLGDDGHTASIFPHQIHLWKSGNYSVVATHPVTGQKRISVTGQIINNSKNIAFFVTGESKSKIVYEVIEHKHHVRTDYPAALVGSSGAKLIWYLDTQAAKLLG